LAAWQVLIQLVHSRILFQEITRQIRLIIANERNSTNERTRNGLPWPGWTDETSVGASAQSDRRRFVFSSPPCGKTHAIDSDFFGRLAMNTRKKIMSERF